jgi:hypothetical protein
MCGTPKQRTNTLEDNAISIEIPQVQIEHTSDFGHPETPVMTGEAYDTNGCVTELSTSTTKQVAQN